MVAFTAVAFTTLLAAAQSVYAAAGVEPSEPSNETIVKAGTSIDVQWAKDTSGTWTNMTIQFMTGDNFNMVFLQDLAVNIDGTKVSSLSIPAPEVSPYSQIYFLQFINNGDTANALWCTRFTMADADGKSTAPPNATQPDGKSIGWGVGKVVKPTVVVNALAVANTTSESASAAASPSADAVSASVSASASAQASATDAKSAAPSASTSTTVKSSAGRATVGLSFVALAAAVAAFL